MLGSGLAPERNSKTQGAKSGGQNPFAKRSAATIS
jgi:hypothetical protein